MNPRHFGPDVIGGEPTKGFHFDVRARGFTLTPAIRRYAVEHIGAKLAKHARALYSVTVRLEDLNGPKRGPDKRCEIEAVIARHPPVVVEETEEDTEAAMDRAGDRIERVVQRALEERRAKRRQSGRKIVRNRKLLH